VSQHKPRNIGTGILVKPLPVSRPGRPGSDCRVGSSGPGGNRTGRMFTRSEWRMALQRTPSIRFRQSTQLSSQDDDFELDDCYILQRFDVLRRKTNPSRRKSKTASPIFWRTRPLKKVQVIIHWVRSPSLRP